MTRQRAQSSAAPSRGPRLALRDQVALFESLLDGAQAGTWQWNVQTGELRVNARWAAMLGDTVEQVQPMTMQAVTDRMHPDDATYARARWREHFDGHLAHGDMENRMRHREGHWVWVRNRGQVVSRTKSGAPLWVIGTQIDISAQKELEHQLFDAAHTDRLTRLPNRAMLLQRLELSVAFLQSDPSERFALLFLDFDRFKNINDTLGHAAGDQLLVMIAERLRGALRVGDVHGGGGNAVARFGGDEFVVLLADARTPEHALRVARQLLALFAEPYQLAGQAVHSSVSIGIAMGEPDGRSAEDLLRDADIAMYEAKRAGRATAVFFDPCMHQRLKRDLAVEIALRQAIERHEFSLVYQPVIDLETGDVTAVEALLRWTHPELGEVQPTEFVPLAEETSLIVPIGEWVLRQACQHFVHWCHTLGDRAPPVLSVNMSRVQMLQADRLVAHVMAVLAETGMPANRLQLEITERELTKDPLSARALMHRLRTLGLRLAMDDFGTGGSTLTCLRDHPFDLVKIDRSLLHGIADNPDVLAVVHATVTLIENLGMASVAEGVEDAAHIGILQSIGCRYAQGFLFALPMSAQAVAEMPAMAPTPVLPPPMLQAYPASHRLS